MVEHTQSSATLSVAEAVSLLRNVATVLERAGKIEDAKRFESLASALVSGISDEQRTARIEQYKSKLAAWEAEVRYRFDWKLESLRATIAFAQRAVTSAMLVNGGAAVALLAYMGNTRAGAKAFAIPLTWFSAGVALAAITFMLSYVTQFLYTQTADNPKPRGAGWHIAAFAVGWLTYIAFAGGVVSSLIAFTKLQAETTGSSLQEERRNMPPPPPLQPQPSYPTQPPQPAPSRKES